MRWYRRADERLPDPPPLQTRDRATILTGIVVWVIVGLGTALGYPWLEQTDRTWWVWIPPAAIGLGLFGLVYVGRRERHHPTR